MSTPDAVQQRKSAEAVGVGSDEGTMNFTGVWLSRYQYFSSGRNSNFVDERFVVATQAENRLTIRSLGFDASNSRLTMDLAIAGNVITGTWSEETEPNGYYQGVRYHGAIQLLAAEDGQQMTGKWVGYGKDNEINTGQWELTLQDPATDQRILDKYSQRAQ